MNYSKTLWCKSALLASGWAADVLFDIDAAGNFASIKVDTAHPEHAIGRQVERIDGSVIAGVPNLHSHAHQRAMAGLGERAAANGDRSFWGWRQAMYHYVAKIEPDQLYHIARMLYLEMLKAGYTRVAEFQYLHHDKAGKPYANRAEMSLQCRQAARDVGIGLTMLPVLYQCGGFGAQPSTAAQKRFINDAEGFMQIVAALKPGQIGSERLGIAPHSLRAVAPQTLGEILLSAPQVAVTHIHIAEQLREVEHCLQWSGQRPVEWLYAHFQPDDRWCLIHATHLTPVETALVARAGTVVGLCPTTEANLGDGVFDAPAFFGAGGLWGIGSDSQISVSPVEELRWLEYGQRLALLQRNVLAAEAGKNLHTGAHLFKQSLLGGNRACGIKTSGLQVGAPADFIVLDQTHPRLYARAGDRLLDCWIFSGNDNLVADVYLGGRRVVESGYHQDETAIQHNYRKVIDALR